MINLELRVSGSGPAHISFSSGTVVALHLVPPAEGSELGIIIEKLEPTSISLAPSNGGENALVADIAEGSDPKWLAFTIDCTGGGSVSVGFPGSPTVRVNSGSFLGMEFDNSR